MKVPVGRHLCGRHPQVVCVLILSAAQGPEVGGEGTE